MVADWSTLAQLYYGGSYNSLAGLVPPNPGVDLERGVDDSLDIKPGYCTFRLRDDTDLYRPSNAASSLYGVTGQYMLGAFATGGSVRFTGETQYMNPGETDDHQASGGTSIRGQRWVDVRLGGPLARVGTWRDAVTPPVTTQIQGAYATTNRGYWPLDDGRNSTSLANVTYPTKTGSFNSATFEADGPAGSPLAIELQSGGSLSFPIASMSTTAGWQVAFGARISNVDATLRDVFVVRTTTGYTYRWQVDNGGYGLFVTDPAGSTVVSTPFSYGTGAGTGQWIYTRLKVSVVGSNISVDCTWYAQQSEYLYGFVSTFAGTTATLGAPTSAQVPTTAATNGARFAQILAVSTTADELLSLQFVNAFNGYVTERAGDRFTRLCGSRRLPYVIRGSASTTARCGPQRLITMLEQFKELRRSEGALIFDRGDNRGIIFATRDYLFDQAAAPVLDLTWPTHFSGSLDEVNPDIYNLVTASNETGSSATAELKTGRQGTPDPPTGSGRLDRKIEVNLASDGQLADVAAWWLAFWTQQGPRFATLTIDADAQPGLLTALHAAEPGMFARITGRTPDPLLLLILSTGQKTHRKRNVFTFAVAAGAVFNVGVYDDTDSRYDSGTTTLDGALTSSAVSVPIATTNFFDAWSTTAVPYDWLVAGERMRVTAMSSPAFSSGAWRQTATVTRAVNAVAKAQLTAAEVHLADPVYYG
jgi:hypothetical protein